MSIHVLWEVTILKSQCAFDGKSPDRERSVGDGHSISGLSSANLKISASLFDKFLTLPHLATLRNSRSFQVRVFGI